MPPPTLPRPSRPTWIASLATDLAASDCQLDARHLALRQVVVRPEPVARLGLGDGQPLALDERLLSLVHRPHLVLAHLRDVEAIRQLDWGRVLANLELEGGIGELGRQRLARHPVQLAALVLAGVDGVLYGKRCEVAAVVQLLL